MIDATGQGTGGQDVAANERAPETRALEMRAGELLRARGLKLAIAESCTGGLLMHRMTDVPGSSLYLLGGVVAYADQVKSGILGVDAPTIVQQGAVSEPVAAQLAQGVRRALGADIGIGITGIAGPGGGTVEKPVGLTYLGIATPDGNVKVIEHLWNGDRSQNKRSSTDAALELLIAYLER